MTDHKPRFWMPVAIGAILVCIALVFMLHKARVVQRDWAIVEADEAADLAECDRVKGELSRQLEQKKNYIRVLEEGIDLNREEMKNERNAALLRVEEVVAERDAAFAERQELRELLVRVKLDRDNLANELSDCRADRSRVDAEFAKALDENDKLRALVEAKDDAIRRLDGDVNCLKDELKKAQSCVKCHRSHKR